MIFLEKVNPHSSSTMMNEYFIKDSSGHCRATVAHTPSENKLFSSGDITYLMQKSNSCLTPFSELGDDTNIRGTFWTYLNTWNALDFREMNKIHGSLKTKDEIIKYIADNIYPSFQEDECLKRRLRQYQRHFNKYAIFWFVETVEDKRNQGLGKKFYLSVAKWVKANIGVPLRESSIACSPAVAKIWNHYEQEGLVDWKCHMWYNKRRKFRHFNL